MAKDAGFPVPVISCLINPIWLAQVIPSESSTTNFADFELGHRENAKMSVLLCIVGG